MSNLPNQYGANVQEAEGSEISGSILEHVQIGRGCKIFQTEIRGCPDAPIIIEDGVELSQCYVASSGEKSSYAWGPWSFSTQGTRIGAGSRFVQSSLTDAEIGKDCHGQRCSVQRSIVGDGSQLRVHAHITLSFLAAGTHTGSEVSKCILEGTGFVSEHTASYLSLVAPGAFPIVDAQGRERFLEGLPNPTNIGAGTVFANYSGEPLPAESLDASPGSQKGTALVYGAFTAVNSVIVNRYGIPDPTSDPFALLRREDLTILGFGSFAEKKVTGRVPAFSYAGHPHASTLRIGWVLDKHPGILLNLLKKMKKTLKKDAGRLHDLVEGTLRLEIRLLEEASRSPRPKSFSQEQIDAGLRCFHKHLDGRWHINEQGELTTPWIFDEQAQCWRPQNQA
ncbi:MAG: hypothetical protein H6727_13125 [Myxococcales bacterium]|nr:hypothetical protein [Myxococcales bacterium]